PLTQIVKLGAAHLGPAQHLDLLHALAVEREGSFYADPMRARAPYRVGGAAGLAATHGDHHPLKNLNTLVAPLGNALMDAHRIAGLNLREVFTQLRLQGSHQSIGHDVTIPLSNPLHLAASIHFISNLVELQPTEYSIAAFALP